MGFFSIQKVLDTFEDVSTIQPQFLCVGLFLLQFFADVIQVIN